MAHKQYLWKGPATAVEVWSEAPAAQENDFTAEIIFSGQVSPGRLIETALPDDHSQVIGWLAFGLIVETPTKPALAKAKQENPPLTSPQAAPLKPQATETEKKERSDG
jgi:hypothetical protein